MTAKSALQFRFNWHTLLLACAFRGMSNRDLQRVRSYLRQRFDLEEPRWVAPCFEQVWHEGGTPRAVLIADFWHPDLTDAEQWAQSTMRDLLRVVARYQKAVRRVQEFAGLRRRKG